MKTVGCDARFVPVSLLQRDESVKNSASRFCCFHSLTKFGSDLTLVCYSTKCAFFTHSSWARSSDSSSKSVGMTRRTRRYGDGGGGALFTHSNSRSSIVLIVLGTLFLVAYLHGGSGFGGIRDISRVEGEFSCTLEVERAIPVLKEAYGDSMHKVLHVGPDTCSVASKLLKEDATEAWGIEPYDIEDADTKCKGLVRKGIVRVADIKFPLSYRPKSFPLVIVSDALDYLSLKYLNKTLPDLVKVSAEGLVVFTGTPGRQRAKATEVSKFGRAAKLRSSTWWVRYFGQTNLEENGAAAKKFEQASTKMSYIPSCQIFHLKSLH